jgi:enediyne biosynthesis protein E4
VPNGKDYITPLCAAILLSLGGCRTATPPPPAKPATASPRLDVKFSDVTQKAGIRFVHNNGARGLMLMLETNGSGVAVFDFDNDGWQDLFFVNARDWTPAEQREARRAIPAHLKIFPTRPPVPPSPTSQLYRNNGDGTFRDVTAQSGLGVTMYGMGAAPGDFDNDGKTDLYVTAWPRNYLFRNEGGGRFRDVTAQAGVQSSGWGMCAAWLDYDKDGVLDLFVGRYLRWTPRTDAYQTLEGRKAYSNPNAYDGETSQLFRGLGGGKFENVSQKAGITAHKGGTEPLLGKAMGVTVADFNNDAWPDFLVANDTVRNFLFINKGNGTFDERAVAAGVAHDQMGRARAGMGIDTADVDHSNRDSVLIGNFSKEMLALFYNNGDGTFSDAAPNSTVGQASHDFLTFGCLFFDYDNDGWPDILAANGHVQPDVARNQPNESHAQRPLLFRNQTAAGRLSFEEIGLSSGTAPQQKMVARGVAYADFDLDGDQDVVFTTNGGAAHLWRNDGGNKNNAIRLTLRGGKSNRSAIGTLIKAKIGDDVLRQWSRCGSSFLSQSELPVTLGLGQNETADGIAIIWPSGTKTKLENIAANQSLVVDETKGIVEKRPLKK